ncbi:hypothetical protein BDF21DRAFT_365918 [Thamnidium elegans]|uniref:Uncharacterized protein n=1 Tax=Thamnidium elegans TaxID=101142 RepID=A0A8H7SMI4_9FUNG|nr:hypothetical protein INT48_000062 [Thamnidium elegans]KAI8073696.1 hypothetical protein BDF21DRAFT_365918 [Thamnidium elegans]
MSLTQVRDITLTSETLQLKGVTMPAKTFRRCIFILDELLSCYDCFQFLAPVPATALVYHTEISSPMDFKTLECNLYQNKYKDYNHFAQDLCLIWENAILFHRSFDMIYQQAENLSKRYISLSEFIQGGPRPFYLSTSTTDIDLLLSTTLPEERMVSVSRSPSPVPEPDVIFPMYKELEPPKKSNLYFVQALSDEDCNTKKLRGFSNVRLLFQHLNASFFDYMSRSDKHRIPLPRFYIAKNRTLLNEAGTDPNGALAILYNVNIKPFTKDLYRLQATVVICEPMGITHGFDESSMDKSDEYEFCPKAWSKLRVVKVVESATAVINSDMDRSFFKKVYNMYKLSTKVPGDLKKIGDQDIAKEFVHSILNPAASSETSNNVNNSTNLKVSTKTSKYNTKVNVPKSSINTAISNPTISKIVSNPTASKEISNPKSPTVISNPTASKAVSNPTTSKETTTPTSSKAATNPTSFKSTKAPKAPTDPTSPKYVSSAPESSARNMIRITPPALDKTEEKSPSRPVIRLVLKNHDKPTNNTESTSPSESSDSMEIEDGENQLEETRSISSDDKTEASIKSTSVTYERYMHDRDTPDPVLKHYYIDTSKEIWQKLRDYAKEKDVPVVNINQYTDKTSTYPNAEGFFKYVYFLREDKQKVLQTFRRMTISQRTTEIASLLALKGLPHMGQITEVLQEEHGEIIGLSMQRYEKTLKQYTHAHSHHRLTAHQKMDLIIQMLQCIETIHNVGLAHRDLSEVNFMVNETNEKLRDGSPRAELFLIDFGKSKFTNASDVRHWWVEHPKDIQEEYDGEIVPLTKQDLDLWCQQLPWIRAKPDHGYRLYRSVQTLPKNRTDTEDLPWLVNPLSEDIYSLGTIIWKTFSETEPWYGILDTDLKGLRETVGEDYHIERALDREVPGKLSKELLLKFLKVSPEHRKSATEVLSWLSNMSIQDGLIAEWEEHAPVGRQKRHAKALFRYDDEQAANTDLTPQRKKQKSNTHSTNNISHGKYNIPSLQLHIPTRTLSPPSSSSHTTAKYHKSITPATSPQRKLAPRSD